MANVQFRSDRLLTWLMKRTNTFAVRPLSDDGEQVLRDLLDASGALEGKYKAVLGASTAQTVRRTNSEAWRGFFENKNAYHDESNTSVTEHPEPPGFRGVRNRIFLMVGESRFASTTTTDVSSKASSERTHTPSNGASVPGSKSLATRTGPTTRARAGWTCGTTRQTAPSELRNP